MPLSNKTLPRIVIDARMVSAQGHGIANYVLQMAEALEAERANLDLAFLVSRELPKESRLREWNCQTSEIPFLHPKEVFQLGKEIAKLKPALYHSPSFASLLQYPCPHVQTIHDLNHLYFGSLPHKLYYRIVLVRSARTAKALATVSRTAKREIEEWLRGFGVNRDFEVIFNPIRRFPTGEEGETLRKFQLEKGGYFFCLSNPKPHKNLLLLEKAYQLARKEQSLPPLVISVRGESGDGVVKVGSLQEREISALLRNGRAFFFPSLYEGFGRPPLEAALEGCVPLVSDIPVHREALAGVKEASFLSPKDVEVWKQAFLKLADTRPAVSAESQSWIETQYSLESLRAKTLSFYEQALER